MKQEEFKENGEERKATKFMYETVFEHFGLDIREFIREKREFDFLIYDTEKAEEATGNMGGFGLDMSQRIIIDYDKDYGKLLIRRERRERRK